MLANLNAWLSGSSYPFQLLLTFLHSLPSMPPPGIFRCFSKTVKFHTFWLGKDVIRWIRRLINYRASQAGLAHALAKKWFRMLKGYWDSVPSSGGFWRTARWHVLLLVALASLAAEAPGSFTHVQCIFVGFYAQQAMSSTRSMQCRGEQNSGSVRAAPLSSLPCAKHSVSAPRAVGRRTQCLPLLVFQMLKNWNFGVAICQAATIAVTRKIKISSKTLTCMYLVWFMPKHRTQKFAFVVVKERAMH